uniref:Uncharacterized protein n=1 Tax=Arundo donax TaxID=35708 RepID=A0A0A8YPG1_ARUDO
MGDGRRRGSRHAGIRRCQRVRARVG